VIAAGANRSCEVPIRTIATSILKTAFLSLSAPKFGGNVVLLQAFTAIKFKPVKPNK
jgi:hypothetical protein